MHNGGKKPQQLLETSGWAGEVETKTHFSHEHFLNAFNLGASMG